MYPDNFLRDQVVTRMAHLGVKDIFQKHRGTMNTTLEPLTMGVSFLRMSLFRMVQLDTKTKTLILRVPKKAHPYRGNGCCLYGFLLNHGGETFGPLRIWLWFSSCQVKRR